MLNQHSSWFFTPNIYPYSDGWCNFGMTLIFPRNHSQMWRHGFRRSTATPAPTWASYWWATSATSPTRKWWTTQRQKWVACGLALIACCVGEVYTVGWVAAMCLASLPSILWQLQAFESITTSFQAWNPRMVWRCVLVLPMSQACWLVQSGIPAPLC